MDIPSLVARIINEDPDDNHPDPSKMTLEEIVHYTICELGERWPEAEAYLINDPGWAYVYATRVIRDRWPEAEPYIKKDPRIACLYAKDVLNNKRWPEAEPHIKKDPEWAYIYTRDVLEEPWPEAEPYIMKNPEWAYKYAKDILHGKRWLEAEPYIMKDPEWAYKYAKDILEEPWPEAEPIIMKETWTACEYAKNVLKEPWPEAEPIIMKNPQWAYLYAKDVLHKPWPEAESYIIKEAWTAYEYAKNVLKEPWPEAEPIIMKEAWPAYNYAKDVLEEPWPEAEPTIMKDLRTAYLYAENILHKPWPEVESIIIKNPTYAYKYAKYVLKEPWPEAEPIIMKSPILAYRYAKYVLEEPWPEAEPYIKKNLRYWAKYKYFLRELEGINLDKQVNKSKFFKRGYKIKYLPHRIPGKMIKENEYFTLLISSLESDVEKAIPKELYSLMDLHYIGSKNKFDKFIGWIGGAITDDAVWVQEIQSDLLQRTWQLQSKEKFLSKKNKQLEKKKELFNQLQDELNKLLNYYQYPPLSKAYGLDEKIEHLKQEQKRLRKEIENIEGNKNLKFYPQYAKFKSKLENLYLKWIEAFYHIVIWYAKKLSKNKLYIIPSETVASLWGRDVGGEGSVYYRAYDGIAKKLGAKLVTIDNQNWWLLELNSFTPMESKDYQK